MPRDGSKTRLKILDETTKLVLENGFAGTSIDQILEKTDLTKGAFFYHFKNKADLAKSMMEHFAASDIASLNHALESTEKYEKDPKKRLLKFVQVFVDAFKGLKQPYEGCLYASYIYEPEQFNKEIKEIVSQSILKWREELVEMLKKAMPNKTKKSVDFESLADMFSVILEGAFITSKALNDPDLTYKQLLLYKDYLFLLSK